MFKPCVGLKHRMAPPTQNTAKQHGYVPLRAASPPRDGSTSREYPLNRRVSPGVEHRRPAPRGNPKGVGKNPIAPGQVFLIGTRSHSCFTAFVERVTVVYACPLKAWVATIPFCVSQPAAGPRVKDKFVSLPDELDEAAARMARQHTLDLPSTVFEVGSIS